jgi:hypothetical protein
MQFPRLFPVTGVLLLLLAGPLVRSAAAQLISPGKLSETHAELEGIRSCTSCHELRARGIEAGLCLDCHVPLRGRIEAGEGYHLATDASDGCARCHKEHFGREFALVRWEPSEFEHSEVGWEPEGAHTSLDCRECHTSALVRSPEVRTFKGRYGALSRTYLGLQTECVACHQRDDPHDDQFSGRTCDTCHGQEGWDDPVGFDHDQTRYRLTGLHARVECAECHPPQTEAASGPEARTADLRFTDLSFGQCSSCHIDEHDGGMGATCSACHVTSGWNRVGEDVLRDLFDHAGAFQLEGAHAETECASCHGRTPYATDAMRIRYRPGTQRKAYPSPVADGCVSCHLDEHDGEFVESAAGGACDRCHGQAEWYPARYDFRRHNDETTFLLEGAHLATPCIACHPGSETNVVPEPRFRIGSGDACVVCHAPDDPHGGQFEGQACDSCHGNRAFDIHRFDHDRARYRLDGAHGGLECAECHPTEPSPAGGEMRRYRPLGTECADCHGGGA